MHDSHLRVADLLGAERLYGPASTHVILALEELTKSWVLTIMKIGVDVPTSFVADVMKLHSARHGITFGTLFSRAIRGLVFNAIARVYQRSGSIESLNQFEKELKKELKSRFRSLGGSTYKATLEWIGSANASKNRGLYVDFDGQKWSHPGSVSKKSFIFGYQIAEDLIREQGRTLQRIHKSGFRVDDAFTTLMNKHLTTKRADNPEQFMKDMAALALSEP